MRTQLFDANARVASWLFNNITRVERASMRLHVLARASTFSTYMAAIFLRIIYGMIVLYVMLYITVLRTVGSALERPSALPSCNETRQPP